MKKVFYFMLKALSVLKIFKFSSRWLDKKAYKMQNIFLEKSCRRCVWEASPRPFCKKSKLNVSLDQKSKMS